MTQNLDLLQEALSATGLRAQVESAGFEQSLPEPGDAPARLVGYVEMGTHPQPDYQGDSKPPAREIVLTFEVFGTKNTREIEVDGVKKKVGALLRVNITEKLGKRAKFMRLIGAMRYGRSEADKPHISHMLNEVFLVTIRHGVGLKSKKAYATLQSEDGSFMIRRPVVNRYNEVGELLGEIDLSDKTPEASIPLRMFLVDNPSLNQWKSIEISGTYKKKIKADDGTEIEEEKSKNFLQDMVRRSLDWSTSPMRALLVDTGTYDESSELELADAIEIGEEPEAEDVVEVKEEAPKAETKKTATAAKVEAKVKAAAPIKAAKEQVNQSVEDDLAAMGL